MQVSAGLPLFIVLLWAAGCAWAPAALAEDVESIVKALAPKPKAAVTRSFVPGQTRGIEVQGDTAPPAEDTPSIDLYVNFEYDSSALTMSDAQITVDTLGRALNDPRLNGLRFQIVGHTDARGGDEYNMQLSLKRAEAVRARLTQFHKIDGGRITVEGHGRRELKDPSRPEDGINRRVQIKTLTGKTS